MNLRMRQGPRGRLRAPLLVLGVAALAAFAFAGCGDDDDDFGDGSTPGQTLSGSVSIDGSSTVFPITEAVAEEFRGVQRGVTVTVGVSGTGGGFKRFCAGETDISDASRPIKPDSEAGTCEAAGIEYVELPVAYDGLSVVVSPENDWVTCMTVQQLNMIWSPESEGKITKWSQIDPSWPDEDFVLYGPGTDSGTFDYFTGAINGEEGASRTDYTPSEDDNVLVQGVAGDKYALGYFGLAYLEENLSRIKGVEIDGGNGCVTPNTETVESGEYAPLSRALFIYVNKDSMAKPEVKAFVDFYLENAATLSADVGYVQFPANFYEVIMERWASGEVGSIFSGSQGSVGEILGVS